MKSFVKIDKLITINNSLLNAMFSQKFSYVLSGKTFSTILQAVFYLILAAILDPDSYGNISYIIALAGTFAIISRFGSNHSVTVYLAKNNIRLANSINLLTLISTSIASIILLTIDIFAALLCFGLSIYFMSIHNLLGLKKYKKFMTMEIIRGILIILIPIIFYFLFELNGILLGMSLSYLICSLDFFKNISYKQNMFYEINKNLKTLIHNFGVDFSTKAPRFIDKLIIFPILGFTNLGIYQLNIQILFGLEILPLALHSFLLSEESSGKNHKKINLLIIITTVLIAITAIFIGPFFISEFFPKYSTGIISFQILILSIIPLTISSIINAKLQAKESTKVGFSALIRIGSLLVLISILGTMFGLIGISLSVFLSTLFYAVFLFILYKKSLNSKDT